MSDFRQREKAKQADSFTRPAERPYIHLLDGGVVDNLGLEPVLWSLSSEHSPWSVRKTVREGRVKKVVIVVVNAAAKPPRAWDRNVDRPTIGQMLNASLAGAQDNKSVESLGRLHDVCAGLERQFSAQGVELYVSEVSFDYVNDTKSRAYFNRIRTDLELSRRQVDDVRRLGGSLLLESPRFQDLLVDLGGSAAAVE